MDELLAIFLMVLFGAAVSLSGLFIFAGTFDETVVRACHDRGYWQTGQTRVICSIEVPTTQEQTNHGNTR